MEDLKKKILNSDVVSFDMFDTLVTRIVDKPEVLFDIIGKKFNIDNFRNIRINAQAELGLQLQNKKGIPHANIDEVYKYMEKKYKIENSDKLMKFEIELEKKSLFQNPNMFEIYNFCLKNNKTVVVTSDMYILEDDILSILKSNGYKKIDRLFLSSKERKAKFEGTLFDLLIEKYSGKKILHIGDSQKDDVLIPNSKGIDTYYYTDLKTEIIADNIDESIHNGIIKLLSFEENSFWEKIGFKAGLLYTGILNHLLKVKQRNIYFLARDGYNLYNLFNKYNKDKTVQSSYMYASRRALLLASIDVIDTDTMKVLPPFTFGQTVKEVLDYIGLSDCITVKDLKKVGFNSFDDIFDTPEKISNFKNIYLLKEDEVLKKCAEERKYALNYLNELNFFNDNNLVFDCGWNGSSQYFLQNLLKTLGKNNNLEFYYTGIFPTTKSMNQLSEYYYDTYVFDINKNIDLYSRFRDCVVILELFFGAVENSVLKYSKDGIEFDDYENDFDYKNEILSGLNKYLDFSMKYYKFTGLEIDPVNSLKPIISLIENPSEEEAIIIGNIENVDAFAKQSNIHKYIAKLDYDSIKENENIEIYWKYGILARNDIDKRVKKHVIKRFNMKRNKKFRNKYIIGGINSPQLTIKSYGKKVLRILENGELRTGTYECDSSNNIETRRINLLYSNSKVEVIENNNIIKKINNKKFKRYLRKVFSVGYVLLSKIGRIFNKVLRGIKKCGRIIKRLCYVLYRAIRFAWKKYHFLIPPKKYKELYLAFKNKMKGIDDRSLVINPADTYLYNIWLNNNEEKTIYTELKYKPLISFVIPVYNVSKELLSDCLNSILNQKYDNIEICLADDCSTNNETINTLKFYEKKDKRIKVIYREKNGHISVASNSALEMVTGEFVAMMDNDDIIPENSIYEIVKALNIDDTIDMIYTDEDKIDENGTRCYPHFKSDYAPDTLMSLNYFCHFTVLRTSILREIGGWKIGYEGAQDWDLFLRFVEKARKVHHIPKILYHWRIIPGSTAMNLGYKEYVTNASFKLLEDALDRRKTPGIVHMHEKVPYYWIEYTYPKEPLISIIIPTKDYASTLDLCLKSIYKKTTYKNFEIIVVDNRSVEKETFVLFEKYKKKYNNFSVVKADMEFNYSKINNLAVSKAKGEYVLLLNNDTEVITPNWLNIMVGYAQQSHIGTVGAKLYYPDKTVQHGGVLLGVGGAASHAFINHPMESSGVFARLDVPYNYTVVTAACLMVEKKKYLEVGGLTEELKVAYNDVDFNIKLFDKGYYNIMVPMVELYHYESKSRGAEDTDEKKKRFEKETKYLNSHWAKYIKNDPMYNPNLSDLACFMLDKNKEDR